MKIIEELKRIMDELKLSPEQVSQFIGCSGKQIRRWIAKESVPSLISRRAIQEGIKKIRKTFRDEYYEKSVKDRDIYRRLKREITFEEKDWLLDCAHDYSL